MKKRLSLFLTMIIVCAVFLAVYSNAAMSISTFNSKLSSFRSSRYDHDSTYVDDPTNTGGYQCFGFANEVAKYIFGSYPTNSMGALSINSGWTRKYGSSAIDTLAVGDIVRYWYHSIFITGINGDTITFCQANSPSGTNRVSYGNTISRSTLKSRVSETLSHSGASTTGWVAHYTNGVTPGNTPSSYSIYFDANGATSNVPSNTTTTSSTYTLPSLAPRGFKFGFYRWYVGSKGYNPGDTISITGDTTIKAGNYGTPNKFWLMDSWGTATWGRYASKGKGQAWFEIQPHETGGTFVVYSMQEEFNATNTNVVVPTDTYGELYDANGNLLAHDDDSGDGRDFKIKYTFRPNTTYYIAANFYSTGNTGSIYLRTRRVYDIRYYCSTDTGVNLFAEQDKEHDVNLTLTSSTPTRTGYTFKGWSKNSSGSTVDYYSGATLRENSDLYLYAVWEPHTYSVTYNANGGSDAPASQTKLHGTRLTLTSSTPTRDGYTFKGWSTISDGAVNYAPGASYSSNSSITLYAVWESNTYTVTYDTNGGSNAPASQTKTHGTSLTLSNDVPTREGYTFKGWSTTSGGSVNYAPGASYTGNANITLYAVWESNTYTVTYDALGGSNEPEPQTKNRGKTVILSENIPTKTGYTFAGWSTTYYGDVDYLPGAEYTQDSDLELYAVWDIITYTVTYDANGGDYPPAPQTKEYGKTLILTYDIPEREYGTFLGWSTSPDGEVEYLSEDSYINNESITLYAVWEMDYPDSGKCGIDAEWSFEADSNTLTIYGEGRMYGWYEEADDSPWDAFKSEIKTVIIESGITSIATMAFADCENLEDVTIPTTVTEIGYDAFENTAYYNNPSNWTNGVLYIGDCLIYANYTVKGTYRVKNGTRVIASDAFLFRSELDAIIIPESVENINQYAVGYIFEDEYLLNDSLIIYGYIDSEAEFYCIDNGLWFEEYDGYYGSCGEGVEWELFDGTLTISGKGSINSYTTSSPAPWKTHSANIVEVIIEEGVISIGKQAFYSCSSIKTATLPETLEVIDAYAFYRCSALETVIIPDGVTEIGTAAFRSCPDLTIYGSYGTAAEAYATNNKIPFKSLYSASFEGVSLVLDGSIGVKVYIDIPEKIVSSTSVKFVIYDTKASATASESTVIPEYDNEKGLYYSIVHVAPKDIDNTEIRTTIVSGSESIAADTIRITDYISSFKELAKTDEEYAEALDLINALDVYAMYADNYFGTDSALDDVDSDDDGINAIAEPTITGKLRNIKHLSTSLVIEGKTTIRHYFEVLNGAEATFKIGDDVVEPIALDEDIVYVEISDIPADELDAVYTVTVDDKIVIDYSALNYVKSAVSSDDIKLRNLAKAMYNYWYAANEYVK